MTDVGDLSDDEFHELAIDEARGRLDPGEYQWFHDGIAGSIHGHERWVDALSTGIAEAQQQLTNLNAEDAEACAVDMDRDEFRAHRAEIAKAKGGITHHRTKLERRLREAKTRMAELRRQEKAGEASAVRRCLKAYLHVYGTPGRVIERLTEDDLEALSRVEGELA